MFRKTQAEKLLASMNRKKPIFSGSVGRIVLPVAVTVLVVVAAIFIPVIATLSGWVTGHILNIWVGDIIVDGLNVIFNTTRFTKELLPNIVAVMALIGYLFKPTGGRSKDK